MADFLMPALIADMETGKGVEWLVKAGDVVAVVETHRGAIDVECVLDGVIGQLAPVGVALNVGAVLAQVGWAVALRGGGLVAPAIHDADRLPLPALMDALRDLVQRARAGGLRSSELTDPTITVTSLGDRGAESVWGVIYPPQVAIFGFGRVVERPWVVDGQVRPRPMVSLTLAADHRASDGHLGGQLLAAIEQALQAPQAL